MALENIGDESFKERILNADKPALVDFSAPYCSACQKLKPVVENLADERDDVLFAQVDVSEHTDTAGKYGVMSIPALILFKDGEEAARHTGFMDKDALVAWLDEQTDG